LKNKPVIFVLLTLILLLTAGFISFRFFLQKKDNQQPKKLAKINVSTGNENIKNTFSLAMVGDIGLGREINWQINQKDDAEFPFLFVKDELKTADISIANLEGPLLKDCPLTRTGFKFCGQARNGQGLEFAGIDLVSLANNHANNFGSDGFFETTEILKSLNIDYFANEKIGYKKINNLIIAFLGYDDIVRRLELNDLSSAVKIARQTADIVVVSFHWGEEYQFKPNNRQITLAHLVIDAGADIVVGHHPHAIQPLDYYNDKPIFYSLGNFLFDQLWSEQTRRGLIVKIYFKGTTIEKIDTINTRINDQYQTEIIKNGNN
jgi:poly-gamma-glutamate capsule biosynthesis protein CapA/YwtB (metallophosphatase superfamily)